MPKFNEVVQFELALIVRYELLTETSQIMTVPSLDPVASFVPL